MTILNSADLRNNLATVLEKVAQDIKTCGCWPIWPAKSSLIGYVYV